MIKLSEISPVTLAMHQFEQRAAEEELRYLTQRRDAQNDKIRFGLLGLNAGSLLALISALGGSGAAATWLGFTPQNSLVAAASFIAGVVLAGISITTQQNLARTEAGDASARSLTLQRLLALYEQEATKENHERLGKSMEQLHKLPLTGFQFSSWSIYAQNGSSGAWLMGIFIPLGSALREPWLMLWAKFFG